MLGWRYIPRSPLLKSHRGKRNRLCQGGIMQKADKSALIMGLVVLALTVWAFATGYWGWGIFGLFMGLGFLGNSLPPAQTASEPMQIRVLDFRPDWEKKMA